MGKGDLGKYLRSAEGVREVDPGVKVPQAEGAPRVYSETRRPVWPQQGVGGEGRESDC